MVSEPSIDVSLERLGSFVLNDLVRLGDTEGSEAVVEFLDEAVTVAGSFLAAHGKVIETYPTVVYDQYESGVSYDPYHDEGEVLICGGPRGVLRGGEEVLAARTAFTQRSLLTILTKSLLHVYHVQLADAGDQRADVGLGATPAAGELEFYTYGLPVPAVEYGFTTLWDVYLEGDITDRSLREDVIDAWTTWYDRYADIQTAVYEAVAYTLSDRISEAGGTPRERICYAFEIQEPLVRDGDVSTITRRL